MRRRCDRARRTFLRSSGHAVLGLLAVGASKGGPAAMDEDAEEAGPGDGVIRLFLCGDVMTGRGIDQVLAQPSEPRLCEPYVTSARTYVELAEAANGPIPKPVEPAYIWGDALDELQRLRPDVRVINLETSITTSEECVPKGINYRMHPANVDCLTAAGVDCCALANNHVLDWDVSGLRETLETLEAAKLAYAGAGRGLAEAERPAVLEAAGKGRVVVFSFGTTTSGMPRDWAARPERPGVNLLEHLSERAVERVGEQVRAVKRPGDVVVASIHWGSNWGYRIPQPQQSFARALVEEAGVDAVHGHSSHHPRGLEVHRGKPILYGCGDFLNDYEGITGYEEYRGDLALMYFLDIEAAAGRLRRLTVTPLQIRKFRLHRASPHDARWLQATLDRESSPFGTRVELDDDGRLTASWL